MSATEKPTQLLTESEMEELLKKVQAGDLDAKEELLVSYFPLAKSMAKQYNGLGVSYEDLYQEACYGILVAMEHFDSSRSSSFSTCASYYIKKYISDALLKQNLNFAGSFGEDLYYAIRAYLTTVATFQEENGRPPSDAELMQCLNISPKRLQNLKNTANIFTASQSDASLILNNYSAADTFRPVEDEVIRLFEVSDLRRFLTPREAEIVIRRCGFHNSGEKVSWPMISAETGLSIEGLRKIYNSAIAKLRRLNEVKMNPKAE